jgi:glycosyltransferase involved in cell wall biosynthesis
MTAESSDGRRPGGVNLIGWPQAGIGIGEDIRAASRAFYAAGIGFTIRDFGQNLPIQQSDLSVRENISFDMHYLTNICFMPPGAHYQLTLETDPDIWRQRYNIGSWPWELPRWPHKLSAVLDVVNEVWAPTNYVMEAFQAAQSKTRLTLVPLVVELPADRPCIRAEMGIDPGQFMFLFVYDALSSHARKNPLAVIGAFKQAFAKRDNAVRLVVKSMNTDRAPTQWSDVVLAAATDSRITLISENYARSRIIALLNSADAFISLHRSEGFGRLIAESMLLGKPVIVSNFSGNLDYTTTENALLTQGRLRPVEAHEYDHTAGQWWFEPDTEDAANNMRRCRDDATLRQRLGEAGRSTIVARYSKEVVGRQFREILASRGLL